MAMVGVDYSGLSWEFQVVFCSNLLGCVKLLSKKVRSATCYGNMSIVGHIAAESARIERSKALSGVGNEASRLGDMGERRELPQRGLGRNLGRKRFCCFLGAPERLSLQYLSQILHFSPQILRLNYHQLGCRPSLSSPCLMLSYVRNSCKEI